MEIISARTWIWDPLEGGESLPILKRWEADCLCLEIIHVVVYTHSDLPSELHRSMFTSLLNARLLHKADHNSSLPAVALSGDISFLFFAIAARISMIKSAAATEVVSAAESYGGLTSTTSAPTRFNPSRPLIYLLTSRVVQPPDSGVPVAGAILGSRTSEIST